METRSETRSNPVVELVSTVKRRQSGPSTARRLLIVGTEFLVVLLGAPDPEQTLRERRVSMSKSASADEAKANATLLQAVAETGEILAKLLNMNTLLPRAVELIQERFGFYHVQVFLLDETNEYASLAASTGATP